MPEYEFIGEFVTLLIPASRSSRRDEARSKAESGKREAKNEESLTSSATEDLVSWLRGFNSHYQLAPHWTAEELAALQPPGLCAEHFCLVRENGRITACAALWDQRAFKQTVIRGYVPWLMRMRPLLNFVSGITENARLPAVEETLANAFVSQLAGAPEETEQLITIVNQLRSAAQRQIELLTMGFAANDPRLATVRGRFRCREYRSRLYIVRWPGLGAAASALDNRCLAPEVALL
jgi:hypothetical protein